MIGQMNSKELYKDVMSFIQPSENVIERLNDMTETKTKFRPTKSFIAVLVILATLIFAGITANAATDGAVAEYINNTVKVLVNGKEADADITIGKNGEKCVRIDSGFKDGTNEIVIENEENGTEDIIHYDVQFEDDGVAFSSDGYVVVKVNNFQEPTTSESKQQID